MNLLLAFHIRCRKSHVSEAKDNPPLAGSEGAGRIVNRGNSVGVTKNVVPHDYLSNKQVEGRQNNTPLGRNDIEYMQ
jgi:hypothetical protein